MMYHAYGRIQTRTSRWQIALVIVDAIANTFFLAVNALVGDS